MTSQTLSQMYLCHSQKKLFTPQKRKQSLHNTAPNTALADTRQPALSDDRTRTANPQRILRVVMHIRKPQLRIVTGARSRQTPIVVV